MNKKSNIGLQVKILKGNYADPKCANWFSRLYARICYHLGAYCTCKYVVWCFKHSRCAIVDQEFPVATKKQTKKKGDK